jgi:putative ABC transport system permease protein
LLKNYLRVAFRNLRNHKAYSLINIIGLAVGVACCILILIYVLDELSYDKFNRHYDRIYRVEWDLKIEGRELNMASSPTPLGATLLRQFPEVAQYTRICPTPNMLIRYKNNIFNETGFFWADSTLFDIFTMPFIEGDPETALVQPHTVVLTESLARKYFGSENPMGKVMNFEDGTPYTVTGVVKDCPLNSHFKYDMFASMSSADFVKYGTWLNGGLYTYVLLKGNASPSFVQRKIPSLIREHAGPELYKALGVTLGDWEKKGNSYRLHLEPLTSIHLHSHLEDELQPNGDIKYVYIFSIIALFILLIACINFMNLSTARSSLRSKEVGVRKVLGSSKSQLVRQFLAESFLLTFISILAAVVLVELFLPAFNGLVGRHLQTGYFNSWLAIPALLVTLLIVGLIAGSYPSFFLSSFQPAKVLKSSAAGNKGNFLRSGLVVFQFIISIVLFVSTFVVYTQLRYIQNAKLGFDKDHILVIQRAWALENHADAFKQELLKNRDIVDASNTSGMPGQAFDESVFRTDNAQNGQQYLMSVISSDYDFTKAMGIKIEEGRYFSREFPSDSQSVVLNESAVRTFGLTDPVGKRIRFAGDNIPLKIIGVVKDFHYGSLHEEIRPLVMMLRLGQTPYFAIQFKTSNVSGFLSYVRDEWRKFVPGKPFEYYFLGENLDQLYRAEQKTGKIFTSFSALAILIACLGLYGLAAFTAERRTKEIGIRKTLGSSVAEIVFLLSKQFTKWVLLANIVAWPVAYFAMNSWLEDFAYRVDMTPWAFIVSALAALTIAQLTVGFHAVRAATSNPVESLRYE